MSAGWVSEVHITKFDSSLQILQLLPLLFDINHRFLKASDTNAKCIR